jgi:hypothetical protein
MAGLSRLKDGVASVRLCPATHVLHADIPERVDARTRPGMTNPAESCLNSRLTMWADPQSRPPIRAKQGSHAGAAETDRRQ